MDGFRLIPGALDEASQRALLEAVLAGMERAPPYRPVTPGSKPMRIG